MERCSDSHILNCIPLGGKTRALYVQGGGNIEAEFLYLNGGLEVNGHKQFTLNNFFVDIAKDIPGMECAMRFSSLAVGRVRCIGDGVTTNPGILMNGTVDYCDHNVLSGIICGRLGAVPLGTRRWDYAVEEANVDQIDNSYSDIISQDCSLGALRVLSPSSHFRNIGGKVVIV